MDRVRTSYAALRELPLSEDAARVWLSPSELTAYLTMRSPKRRDTFLAGRILLKRLLIGSTWAGRSARDLAIESRSLIPGHGERPVLTFAGAEQPLSLSIAHSDRGVLVACAAAATASIGVDLVARATVSEHVQWTLTAAEREWLAAAPESRSAAEVLWARKEALYKACQRGEGFQPAMIEAVPGRPPIYTNFHPATELLCLETWRIDGHIAALAVATPRPAVSQPESRTTMLAA